MFTVTHPIDIFIGIFVLSWVSITYYTTADVGHTTSSNILYGFRAIFGLESLVLGFIPDRLLFYGLITQLATLLIYFAAKLALST
jgi:hypothetical protein